MKKTATIHSTASHGASYLYQLIDHAIWLLSNNPRLEAVSILLHPVSPHRSILRRAKEKIYLFLHSPVCALRSLAWKISRFDFSAVSAVAALLRQKDCFQSDVDAYSLYARVYLLGQEVSFETSLGSIAISRSRSPLIKSFYHYIQVCFVTIFLWYSCKRGFAFDPQLLLRLRYRNIHIGDLVASLALRQCPRAGGSLRKCRGIRDKLFTSIAICDYIHYNIGQLSPFSFVAIPELTYLQAIYRRALRQRGANIIEHQHYSNVRLAVPSNASLSHPLVARGYAGKALSSEELSIAKSYLSERIERPGLKLWYLPDFEYDSIALPQSYSDAAHLAGYNKVAPVIFLHSFDDSQYFFGLDGFDDLSSWVYFTIDTLLANTSVGKIFIKEHPGIDYTRPSSNKTAVDRLKSRYNSDNRIFWASKRASVVALSSLPRFVGITHHGSVAEELAYLGKPVIASTAAPWGSEGMFLTAWSNIEQYRSILECIGDHVCSRDPHPSLYSFVYEYRLSAKRDFEAFDWPRYSRLYAGTPRGSVVASLDAYSCFEKNMRDLRPDSEAFISFVRKMITEAALG